MNYLKEKQNIILIILFIIAILVRTFMWPTAISQVNCDEIMTAVNAKAIADNGTDTYGTNFPVYLEAWGTMGQSVMLLYFMAIFIKIFGLSIATVRIPMLLISIISLFIFYDLIKRIFKNRKIALIGLAFLAICPWHILQSIWSIDCNMFPHFLLISVYFLYRGITEKKWMIYISMVFFALSMYTYGVAVYIVPLFLLISGIYLLKKKSINWKQFIACITIYICIAFPILIMYVINALHIEQNIHIGPITIQYFANNQRTSDMLFFSENFFQTLGKNLLKLGRVLVMQYDGLEWNATPFFGTIYQISIIFLIFAIFKIVKKKQAKENIGIFLMLLWLGISMIVGVVINDTNINRLNVIWYPIIFFTCYGIYLFIEKYKNAKYVIATIFVILFIGFSIFLYSHYTGVIDMSGCFSRKYIDAIQYSENLKKEDMIYSNLLNDGTLDIYIQFQSSIDGTSFDCIREKEVLQERLNHIQENEIFILRESDLEKIELPTLNVTYFGEYMVVTK